MQKNTKIKNKRIKIRKGENIRKKEEIETK